MKTLGVALMWSVGVPGILFGITYGMGCSKDAENSAMIGVGVKGNCPDDGNLCTVEGCSTGELQISNLDGIDVANGPADECRKWVCKNGTAKQEPLDKDADCLLAQGKQGHCNNFHKCVECTESNQCTAAGRPICHNATCVACIVGGVACGNSKCDKCNGEDCNAASECARGDCTVGRGRYTEGHGVW